MPIKIYRRPGKNTTGNEDGERKLKQVWEGSPDPVTVRIEIYSLGVHAGMHQEKDSVSVPLDILEEVSRRFDIKTETLARAYVKGAIDGMRERERSAGRRRARG